MPRDRTSLQPDLIAGRYQVLRAIGRGGMGTVWLCRDEILGREVAVKQIGALPGESASETKRALREARSAAALNHPNAVAIYDVVNHDERPWLVMEYVDGQTLADEITRDGQLSPKRVADIGAQLAGALARAHERRIVHRDIKPANVLIDKAGRPKISDFGIARGHLDEQLTQVGFVTGTPGYLSPELARGADPHPASDVWALGATLYAAVEGQAPYEPRSNPIALLRAIATERPRPMTHAGAIGPAIDAMMHEDPAQRWDMATSAQRLRRIAQVPMTTVMPILEPGHTSVLPIPEPTQRTPADAPILEPTQRTPAEAPVLEPTQLSPAEVPVLEPTQPTPAEAPRPEPTRRFEVAARVAAVAAAATPERPETVAAPEPANGAPVPPAYVRFTDRHSKPVLYAALLVAALGVVLLLTQLGDNGSTPVVREATKATAVAKAPTAPGSTGAKPPSTKGLASKGIESFLSSYYSDVTKDTDHTWDQLSPRMQNAAGGRGSYDGFWRTIDKVRVNSTRSNQTGTSAVVNLTFTRNDGTTSTETHQFTFVTNDEDYLIDGDKLIS